MKVKLGFTLLVLCMLIVTACSSSTSSGAKKEGGAEKLDIFLGGLEQVKRTD